MIVATAGFFWFVFLAIVTCGGAVADFGDDACTPTGVSSSLQGAGPPDAQTLDWDAAVVKTAATPRAEDIESGSSNSDINQKRKVLEMTDICKDIQATDFTYRSVGDPDTLLLPNEWMAIKKAPGVPQLKTQADVGPAGPSFSSSSQPCNLNSIAISIVPLDNAPTAANPLASAVNPLPKAGHLPAEATPEQITPKLRLQYHGCGGSGESATVSFMLKKAEAPGAGIKLMGFICKVSAPSALCAGTNITEIAAINIGMNTPLQTTSMIGTWTRISTQHGLAHVDPGTNGYCFFKPVDWITWTSGQEASDKNAFLSVEPGDWEQLMDPAHGLSNLINPNGRTLPSKQKTHANLKVNEICIKNCKGELLGQCDEGVVCKYGSQWICDHFMPIAWGCFKESALLPWIIAAALIPFLLGLCFACVCCAGPAEQSRKIGIVGIDAEDAHKKLFHTGQ